MESIIASENVPSLVKLGEDKPKKHVPLSHFNQALVEELKNKAYQKYLTFSNWELEFYIEWSVGSDETYYMDILGLGVWDVKNFDDIYENAVNIIIYYHNGNGKGVDKLCYLK